MASLNILNPGNYYLHSIFIVWVTQGHQRQDRNKMMSQDGIISTEHSREREGRM